jgi:hypothetical protein
VSAPTPVLFWVSVPSSEPLQAASSAELNKVRYAAEAWGCVVVTVPGKFVSVLGATFVVGMTCDMLRSIFLIALEIFYKFAMVESFENRYFEITGINFFKII